MRTALFAFAAALGCAIAAPAAAQDDAPATVAPVAERRCELHVWPTDAVRSTYSGWFHGAIVDGAVQGRDGYKKLPDSILSPEAQVRTLGELDLPALMQLPGYTVVLHPERLPSRVIRSTPGRLVPGTPDCYAELVTDDVFFQQDLAEAFDAFGLLRPQTAGADDCADLLHVESGHGLWIVGQGKQGRGDLVNTLIGALGTEQHRNKQSERIDVVQGYGCFRV